MGLKCETLFLVKTPETRQHFFIFLCAPRVLLDSRMNGKLFLEIFKGEPRMARSGEAAAKVAQTSKCAVSRLSKAAWRTISPAQPIRECERRWNGRRGDSSARCQRSEIAPAAIGFGIVLRRSR